MENSSRKSSKTLKLSPPSLLLLLLLLPLLPPLNPKPLPRKKKLKKKVMTIWASVSLIKQRLVPLGSMFKEVFGKIILLTF
jgi:hypothetical protein